MIVNYDWRPDDPVFIDIETQATSNLKKVGAKAYLRHPDTRLLCLVAKHGNEVVVWAPHGRYPGNTLNISPSACWPDGFERDGSHIVLCDSAQPPEQLTAWAGHTFVAHNAPFDAEGYARFVNVPQPRWCDTVPLARACGLPGGLDALGRVFLGRGKDEGKKAMKLMCEAKVNKAGTVAYPIGSLPLWKKWLQYNVGDVLLLEAIYREVREAGEPDLLDVHSRINNRGIHIDIHLVRKLIDFWEEAQEEAIAEVSRLTNGLLTKKSLNSPAQINRWLQSQGVQIGKSVNRQMLERFYDSPEEFVEDDYDDDRHTHICEVLRLRQSVTRVSKAKLQRILEVADSDGRVRDVLVAYGAHTGRFSGRNIQPHNFARGLSDLDVESLIKLSERLSIQDVRNRLERCKGKPRPRLDDALTTLLRGVISASDGKTLAIADYASIEGRGVAWVAGEQKLLDAFARGDDVYCQMASHIYGRPITKADKLERQVGKVNVLGDGYGMGAKKLVAYAANNKLDLAAAGTTAEACIEAYRNAYPAIAGVPSGKFRRGGIWKDYQAAIFRCLQTGIPTYHGKCSFRHLSGHLHVVLPSGRHLTYRNCSIQPRVPGYAAIYGLTMGPRPTIVYTHHRGYEATLYGGLITENIVQAICRDLLCHSLIACDAAELPVVLHVHDEIVAEVEDAGQLYDLGRLMTRKPSWAEGFPLAIEGFTCPHYVKSPWSDSLVTTEKS